MRFDAVTRKYVDLLKDQASIAATSVKHSLIFDPLIKSAFRHRSAAVAAMRLHRVLDHHQETLTMKVVS